MNSLSFQLLAAALSVGEKRVSAIDNDVPFFQNRCQLANHGINWRTRFHHDHRLARSLKSADKFLQRFAADDVLSLGAAVNKFFRDRRSSIINRHGEPL